jgi:hypothetical protein
LHDERKERHQDDRTGVELVDFDVLLGLGS